VTSELVDEVGSVCYLQELKVSQTHMTPYVRTTLEIGTKHVISWTNSFTNELEAHCRYVHESHKRFFTRDL